MPFFKGFSHGHGGEHLQCPYKGCEKEFDKPTVLTDLSSIPRQSYYACPFCMSKIDVVTEGTRIVDIKPVDYPATVFESPAKCAHFSGQVGFGGGVTDECLICPKVLQCDRRRR